MKPQEIINILIKYNSKNTVFSESLGRKLYPIFCNIINPKIDYYTDDLLKNNEFAFMDRESYIRGERLNLKDLERFLKLKSFI